MFRQPQNRKKRNPNWHFNAVPRKQRCNPYNPICDILLIYLKRNKSQEMRLRETGYFHPRKNFSIFYAYPKNLKRLRKIQDCPEHTALE